MVRLVERRWKRTPAGGKRLRELEDEVAREQHAADETQKARRLRIENLRSSLAGLVRRLEAVTREAEEVPSAWGVLEDLRGAASRLRALDAELAQASDDARVQQLETALARESSRSETTLSDAKRRMEGQGLLEIIRDPFMREDPVWLACVACHGLQSNGPSWDGRYQCNHCKRRGKAFRPPHPSVEPYRIPLEEKGNVAPWDMYMHAVKRQLELFKVPEPIARYILDLFRKSVPTPTELHSILSLFLGKNSTRHIVTRTFGLSFDYPYLSPPAGLPVAPRTRGRPS